MVQPHRFTTPSNDSTETLDAVKRLNRNALRILCLLVAASGLSLGWEMAFSVALGGTLAYLNFVWLKAGVDRILGLGTERRAALVLAGFMGRFVLILGGLFAIIHFSSLSLYGALSGLSIYILAGALEAFFLLAKRTW